MRSASSTCPRGRHPTSTNAPGGAASSRHSNSTPSIARAPLFLQNALWDEQQDIVSWYASSSGFFKGRIRRYGAYSLPELMMKAVRKHAPPRWVELYIPRWLKAPAQDDQGIVYARDEGTPQGGVISPLLANLYLHYAFDMWMKRMHPDIGFERYADDIVIHCCNLKEATARTRIDRKK